MKKGWEMKKLGDMSKIMYGHTAKTSSGSDGVKYLRITDIQNGSVDWNSVPNCPYLDGNFEKYELKYGDIVFARTGATTGKSYLVQNPPAAVFASYLIRVQTNQEEISPEFLSMFFQSASYWNVIEAGISGSAQGGFNAKKLGGIPIPIPPLPEQKKIVTLLDAAFAKIDQAKANIEKNIENAKELFQSKLNEIFSQKGDGWEEKTLIDISKEFGRGKSKHRPRNADFLFGGKYPFVQTGEIRNSEKYVNEYSKTYNEKGLEQSKLWAKGTICITIAANIAETAILDFNACFPDSIIGLIVDPEKATNDYTFYALMFLKSDLQAQGKGSAQDNINLGTFKKQLFPFPDIKTQNEIVDALDILRIKSNAIVKKYSVKLNALQDLKKSLLKKAFAGELT